MLTLCPATFRVFWSPRSRFSIAFIYTTKDKQTCVLCHTISNQNRLFLTGCEEAMHMTSYAQHWLDQQVLVSGTAYGSWGKGFQRTGELRVEARVWDLGSDCNYLPTQVVPLSFRLESQLDQKLNTDSGVQNELTALRNGREESELKEFVGTTPMFLLILESVRRHLRVWGCHRIC